MRDTSAYARIDYDGYFLHFLPNFEISHVVADNRVNYFFDPGSQNGVVVYARPTFSSKGTTSADAALALDRIVTHLKSVGNTVFLA